MNRYALVHDDGDRIIEQTLTENDAVEFWVDLILLEDRKDRNRIRRRECGTEDEAIQYGEVEGLETKI